MPRNSGTGNLGKGPSVHGPAKGFGNGAPKAPDFESGNEFRSLPPNERKAARIEKAWQVREQLLSHEDWRARAYATDTVLGKAMQSVEMTGADGAPLAAPSLTVVFEPDQDDDGQ